MKRLASISGGVAALLLLLSSCSGGSSLVQFDADDSATAEPADSVSEASGAEVELVSEIIEGDANDIPDHGGEGITPDCLPGEGCFGDACQENSQCKSGYCIEHLGGGVCTQTCEEECPSGFTCTQAGEGPDLVFLCVSRFANLCKPCSTNADCTALGAQDVCVGYGSEGSFCGGNCKAHADCPWGFSCVEATTTGGAATKQCVADSGVCPCTEKSILLGLFTPCERSNEHGKCPGKRVCLEGGLSDCDAQLPTQEECNGVDDQCDGDVDEPLFVEGKYVDLCDDGNDCTSDLCKGADGCEHVALDGLECKDGDPCTVADMCGSGVCVGSPVKCNDSNPCTDDSCDETGGCIYAANSLECDDSDPCTVADQCKQGECAGFKVDCDCQIDADCKPLEDGNLCNGTLFCDHAKLPYQCAVVPDSPIECPQPEGKHAPCLVAVCNPADGKCSFAPGLDEVPCNDGDACTVGDHCLGGVCTGGAEANCNDGNPCTDETCMPASGCVITFNADDCNDGSACTTADLCVKGVCTGGLPLQCEDGNLCTDDGCDPVKGCINAPNSLDCDDGNACTVGDHCSGGGCIADGPLVCDDKNPCTQDSCHPLSGCIYAAAAGLCSDGNPCTVHDYCAKGVCQPGPAVICDDKNPCTADSCDAAGLCVYVATNAMCDDGNACTAGDACKGGKCVYAEEVKCDDGNVCTTDSCSPEAGWGFTFNEAPCDDGDICTSADKCASGVCKGGAVLSCDDGNPCTDDACDSKAGCTHTPNTATCDDGNPCTEDDTCSAAKCKGTKPTPCSDGNLCTDDTCDPNIGCVNTPNASPCDDGDKCTWGDKCGNGKCKPGTPFECNDGNVCTDDSCDPAKGCVYLPNALPCDDGNPCTSLDVCAAGKCTAGGLTVCNDNNLCTDDSCDPAKGCVFVVNTVPCDDGNACTMTDVCSQGSCKGSGQLACNDNNLCTDDSCDPAKGCVFGNNELPCSDGNACTVNDVCKNGSCSAGQALTCADGNACTSDACNPATGCVYTPLPDGTSCGGGKTCLAGVCIDCPQPHGTVTFSLTGGQQNWTVPQCVTSVTLEAWGGQGGGSVGACMPDQEDGGKGGYAKGTLSVGPGQLLYVFVGGKGTKGGSGGYNGGGTGGTYAGGGGGGSDVRKGGTGLNDRVLVAGGGGP
ncbi:MAG: hypothetical protein FJ109_14685, partial [Deltaproteobacteria bacterium]|nr:hypothetical protein [Deltaproteobacteria bacterium]